MTQDPDLLFQLAITCVPQIGDVQAKALVGRFESAEAIFKAPRRQLETIEGIGSVRARSIKSFRDFAPCENEIKFIERYHIQPLFFTSRHYPQRLKDCYDSPAMLFYRGTADLNQSRILSVVGTRSNTAYGKMLCEELIAHLRSHDALIVSGLAFGIDAIAHRAALNHDLNTVAVLAHGLDRIYPSQHKSMAKQIAEKGGLLTDFRSGTLPDKQHFPQRNRITAGMSDAVIVIESGSKGGSLITAEIANSYQREVFAFPGRVNDARSEGCHALIKSNKAMLVTNAEDIVAQMGWDQQIKKKAPIQAELFFSLSEASQKIISALQEKSPLHFDELYIRPGIAKEKLPSTLLELELAGFLQVLPGKLFQLC